VNAAEKRQSALAALHEARRNTPGHPAFAPAPPVARLPGETTEQYAQRLTEGYYRRIEAEMAAVAPVKPAWAVRAYRWANRAAERVPPWMWFLAGFATSRLLRAVWP
jgi:hypothetical protein